MKEFMALVLGLLMPFMVSWLKNCDWPDWAKVLLTLVLSIGGGALTSLVDGTLLVNGTLLVDGTLDLESLARSSLIVFTSATVFYKMWFQDTGVNSRLEQMHLLGRPAQPPAPAIEK